jgi:NAD-dependent deacetylase
VVKGPTSVGPCKLSDAVRSLIVEAVNRPGNVVIITGAGVSAESGIPIYRGAKGLWTEEGGEAIVKATAGFFVRHRRESWAWYLARRTEARAAEPNVAHFAIAEMGRLFEGRFKLIAQNIDRLHARAGSRAEEMIELHGHLEGMRCIEGCSGVFPIAEEFDEWTPDEVVEDDDLRLLTCPLCGSPARPHVLWFDEFYDEVNYGFATAQRALANATLCITVGTSGGIPVAERFAGIACRAGATLIDINTRDNPLRRLAARRGGFIEGSATSALQAVAAIVREETARVGIGSPKPGHSGSGTGASARAFRGS